MAGVDDAHDEVQVFRGVSDLVHQRAVQFDYIDRIFKQHLQGGEAVSEIVQGEFDAHLVALVHKLVKAFWHLVEVGFRQLQHQVASGKPAFF